MIGDRFATRAARALPLLALATMFAFGCSSVSDDPVVAADAAATTDGGVMVSDGSITKIASDSGSADASREGGALDVDAGPYPYGPYGSYKPGATTSGARSSCSALVPYTNQFGEIVSGILTLSTANVTISGYDIPAFIVVKADKITIENSCIRGPATLPAAGSRNLISAYAPGATNLVVQDCSIAPDVANLDSQGIQGKSFLAQRNNIFNSVDGIDPLDSDVTILANYIHDLSWFSPDPSHSDNHTHNDCIQLEGGSATVEYNNLEGFLSPTVGDGAARPYDQSNSVMLAVADTNPATTNLLIAHNWMDGGQVCINVGAGAYTNLGTIEDNIFGDNQAYTTDAILLNDPRASIGLIISGNKFGAVDLPLKNSALAGTVVDTGNGVHGG